ncbi:relaxase/mobilization nuclease domain-containing protein [Kordiimonas sp. SCSIO 12603]|uniref:relaxase/mobilization nuclease domain-containing protein n=1 Tax=Kordiimonas sp. SCSIO 12603 TaxID=2829596 RepID=UPI0021048176|nr:relaxase/mobilization nuclease domain-containing protein [Kordiimonas sp. SCSIO 12603]UTW59523.1 relaxase/mobilization nuclease domain-containing protein [Kordiimonas sp. SCSIO 12603]
MIANEIAFGRSFADNIMYNIQGHRNDPNPHKCGWYAAKNIFTKELDVAETIMEATASASKASKPVYHFSIDWDRSEERLLDKEKCIKTADQVLEKIGLQEHQALYFWHVDADHPHMHVVVNRVHERTGKAWDMWKSKERLERAAHETAKEMGFMQIPGKHNELDYAPDKERNASQTREQRLDPLKPWGKEKIAEVKNEIGRDFYEALGWEELSDRIGKSGYELRSKGQGLIITDGKSYTQLSMMGKQLRLNLLEQKFGEKCADYLSKDPLEPVSEKTPKEAYHSVDERIEKHIHREIRRVEHEYARAGGRGPAPDVKTSELAAIMNGLDKFEDRFHRQNTNEQIKKLQKRVEKQNKALQRAEGYLSHHKQKSWELLLAVDDRSPEDKAVKSIDKLDKSIQKLKYQQKTPKTKNLLKLLRSRRKKLISNKRKREKTNKRTQKIEKQLYYRMQKLNEARMRVKEKKNSLSQTEKHLAAKKLARTRNTQTKDLLQKRSIQLLRSIPKEMILNANIPRAEKIKMMTKWNNARDIEKVRVKERQNERDR